eukprot:5221126-Alexandrium_andersonii.AAC.1
MSDCPKGLPPPMTRHDTVFTCPARVLKTLEKSARRVRVQAWARRRLTGLLALQAQMRNRAWARVATSEGLPR